jgi:PIN domain nuclease of toxin-antitoxin system
LNNRIAAGSYLLDTHTAIWALDRPEALSESARKAASSGPNVLSVISYWEIMLKSTKGKLDVGNPYSWWSDALDQLAATTLLLRPHHIAALHSLPLLHKDPFDRILIAQAIAENLTLVTANSHIAQYTSWNLTVIV